MTYPVVSQVALDPVAKSGFLSRPRRQISSLPRQLPHQRLVFEYDGAFVLGDRRLHGDDPHILHAESVSVVDMTKDQPVTAHVAIRSAGAHYFHVAVMFACTVDDPVEVVRSGLTNAEEHLVTYIKGYHKLFELGRDHQLDEAHELWTKVHAQVKAYTTVVPSALPGMTVRFAGLDLTPPEVIARGKEQYETSIFTIRGEHGVQTERRKLERDYELDEQEHLQYKSRGQNDFTRQESSADLDHQIADATKVRNFLTSGPGAADGYFATLPGLGTQQVADRVAALGDREYHDVRREIERDHELRVAREKARADVVRAAIQQGLFNETTGKELLSSFDRAAGEERSYSAVEQPARQEYRAELITAQDDDTFMEEDVRG
ncbi:hypothetical protein GCM10009677_44300 [Sphaerisporangium rubeum]|uniref:Uncharacterized protein n=1 Tax=Sphaerisporangium rubeum TaxID=321317 RepID=A0A7X0I9Q0_9ACTN|nr:hypothetical protein [Sphaerisporangium rubeum]MBB6471055.1 hypothetical protein [Sphaerisporangium rubeum]